MNIIVILAICIFILTIISVMGEIKGDWWRVVALLFALLFSLIMTLLIREHEYKQGQIDAMNGDIKYEMKVETNKDTTYVKKDG